MLVNLNRRHLQHQVWKQHKCCNSVSYIFVKYRRISKIRKKKQKSQFCFYDFDRYNATVTWATKMCTQLVLNMMLRVLPPTNQTWLAINQVLHEKLSQKVELTTFNFTTCNNSICCKTGMIRGWKIKRVISLFFNSLCSHIAKYCTLRLPILTLSYVKLGRFSSQSGV